MLAMNKYLLILIISSALLTGCGKSEERDNGYPFLDVITLSPGADTDSGPLPDLAFTLSSKIEFYYFTMTEEEKMAKAIEIIKLVVATDEFRRRVLNHTYGGQKTFVDNAGLSNAQIYQKILEGAEKLQPARNNRIDAEVELYYEASSIIGYTYASSRRIWVNRKYFNVYTPAGVAHNLFHEWMHKLGFTHSSKWTPSREYSVPYSLGYLVGEIGKDFL